MKIKRHLTNLINYIKLMKNISEADNIFRYYYFQYFNWTLQFYGSTFTYNTYDLTVTQY